MKTCMLNVSALRSMEPIRLLEEWARLVEFPLTCDESSSDSQMIGTIKVDQRNHAIHFPHFPPETPSACFSAWPEAENIFYEVLIPHNSICLVWEKKNPPHKTWEETILRP